MPHLSMKVFIFLFGLLQLCRFAFASDVILSDGRVLKDATIMSQAPRTVIIKHAAGLSSVSKSLLPPELSARYPVDEAAAREADLRAAQARADARELEKAEAERTDRVRTQRAETAAVNAAVAASEAAAEETRYENIRKSAESLARHYFEYEYNPGNNSTSVSDCSVTISEVRPVEGWAGRWLVRGRGFIKYYQSQGRSYMSQTRDFEAYYSTTGHNPSFEVTLR